MDPDRTDQHESRVTAAGAVRVAWTVITAAALLAIGWTARVLYEQHRQAVLPFAEVDSPGPPQGSRPVKGELSELPPGAVVVSNRAKHPAQARAKYHRPDCYMAKRIKPENRIWFDSPPAAEQAGYLPCGLCKPNQPRPTTQPARP